VKTDRIDSRMLAQLLRADLIPTACVPSPVTRQQRRQLRLPAVAAISLGCPKNLVDTEVMLGLLHHAGFQVVPCRAGVPTPASILLVNTCSFLQAARDEAQQVLEEAVHWRRARPGRVLVCAGCWPQMDARYLRARFPEIDALIGPGDVPRIVSVVHLARQGVGPPQPQASPSSYLYDDHTPRLRTTPPWTAYLKIAEGCSHRCRFCVIPRLRGRYRCRPLPSILKEARRLANQGVKELILIAQDTTAYRDHDNHDIADLLSNLAPLEGLHWLRLLYGFPTRVTDRLIETMSAHPTICQYLDLPFQHADPAVLRAMGRPGDADSYLRLIARLRQAMPDITLRSTFLMGFPGESEKAFQRLLDFVEAAQLDHVGTFCYSPEPRTPAAEMPHQVPPEVAQERYHQLMTLQQQISLNRNQRWVGREIEVLIEAPGRSSGEWVGRTFRDAPEIDGTARLRLPVGRPSADLSDEALCEVGSLDEGGSPPHSATQARPRPPLHPGAFLQVRVTAAEPYDLVAELAGLLGRPGTMR